MATAPPYDAIFDFDGVLADSVPLIVEILDRSLRQQRGLDVSDEALRATVGPPFRESVARLCAATGASPDDPLVDEIVAEFRAEYGARAHVDTPVFDGVVEILDELTSIARLSICSSKPRPLLEAIIASWGIEGRFADIEAPAPDQHEPKAEGLRRLMARLAVDPARAVLVGDTEFDAEAARATDIAFVGVAWGVADHGALSAAGAHAIAHAPADLPRILRELMR